MPTSELSLPSLYVARNIFEIPDWLNHAREIAMELHSKENVRKIPEILKERCLK
jgi:hypothetical protein